MVSFPCLGFVFCAVGEGAGGRGIRLSEKVWSFVVLWSVFLVFSVCFFVSFVDVFVGVVKMYAVRECDLFEIFQLANVEIVCAVDYVSCYCCCC